jgi:hypothetical protein
VRFFSRQGNTGDVAAKSESQASVGQLLGYAAGVGLLAVSHSAAYLYSIFAVAVPLHMLITGWMLRVASFEMLTLPRVSWLAKEYVAASPSTAGRRPLGIVTLDELDASRQTGLFGEFYKTRKDNYLRLAPRTEDVLSSPAAADKLKWEACVKVFGVRFIFSVYFTPTMIADWNVQKILYIARTLPPVPVPITPALDIDSIPPRSKLKRHFAVRITRRGSPADAPQPRVL